MLLRSLRIDQPALALIIHMNNITNKDYGAHLAQERFRTSQIYRAPRWGPAHAA